jgi:LPS O-antigen subunit length determinant protein (WzzB/FepE family)
MKKNNSYIADYKIDLGDLARTLWRGKILIFSISVICSLLGYLYTSFEIKKFKTEIKLQNPSRQLLEPYDHVTTENIFEKFISNFESNLLSLDNLEIFVEESRDLDNFKAYLKSRNISNKQYFANKLQKKKEKNIIIPNTYFLVFEGRILDGNNFLNNYTEFVKKKNIIQLKKNIKLSIENRINNTIDAFEIAKSINLENPISLSSAEKNQNQEAKEPISLFYKGTKVLSKSIIIDKKLLQKLENDQFNYNHILDKAITTSINPVSSYFYVLTGFFIGFFLSCIIIFFNIVLKNK